MGGSGRQTPGADLIREETTVNSKGAVYLADHQRGASTVIDIGGMDNKAIQRHRRHTGNLRDGRYMRRCKRRFLEMTAKRLGVVVTEPVRSP